jgi:hypothetical protein
VSGIQSIEIQEGYSTLSASAVIEATSSSLSLGDSVDITMGYDGDVATFSDFVCKKITKMRPESLYHIECNDILIQASDYFLAADDPEKPFQRNNILSLQLVKDLLAQASITNVTNVEPLPSFTWGTNEDGARFNLQSVADAIQFVAQITGNVLYVDGSGVVQFIGRKPYVDGDSPVGTLESGTDKDIIEIDFSQDTSKTRNRITVYGKDNAHYTASASNPYLVVDQTVVIAHDMLNTTELIQGTANVNLTLLNRLTEEYNARVKGRTALRARQVWTIADAFIGTRNVFLYTVNHSFGATGYTQQIKGIP